MSLILLALATVFLSAPQASAVGCVNVEHDSNGGLVVAQLASDGTGVVVGADGQVFAVTVFPDQCEIPPQLIQHFMAQTGGAPKSPVALLA